LFFVPFFANAQGNVAVLFNGNVPFGKVSFLTEKDFSRNVEAESRIFPGVELRLNQDGRVAFGVGFQQWKLKKEGSYVSGWDTSEVKTSHVGTGNVITGTVYVNFTEDRAVQPFVGFGGGILLMNWENKEMFSDGSVYSYSNKRNNLVVKGVAGVNVFPSRHFVISFSGGYVNGPAAVIGFGVTF